MNFGKVAFASLISLLCVGTLFAQVRIPFAADPSAANENVKVKVDANVNSEVNVPEANVLDSVAGEAPVDVENAFVPATDSVEKSAIGGASAPLPAPVASAADAKNATAATDAKPATVLKGYMNGFLNSDMSPYFVEENIVISEGRALVINAGVVLEFAEGAGIDIRGGTIAVMGEDGNPVVFRPKERGKNWKGISVTGIRRSEIQGAQIHGAEFGVAVESGSLELRNSVIDSSSGAAVYAKNGTVAVYWSSIAYNSGVGVWASNKSSVTIDDSKLESNHIAIMAGDKSNVFMQVSSVSNNELAIVSNGDNLVVPNGSRIEDNGVGYTAKDLPSEDVRASLKNNKMNVSRNLKVALASLKKEPENPHAAEFARLLVQDDDETSWKVNGSVSVTMGGHGVMVEENTSGEPFVSGTDTVAKGDKYRNYFQVPGFFANWNAFLQMESPTGQTIEFSMDATHDAWDKFNVRSIQASYKDKYQNFVLGDVHLSANETYLAGIDLLGASYDLNMFHNVAGEPLFVVSAFGGEANKPMVVGKRNPDMYNDYIEDGEAEVQKIAAGGKIRWNMHRRFNGTLGFIGSKDFLDDPIMRDGPSEESALATPVYSSKTFFADGNWLFFPGDIELNGQVAYGGADTSNVKVQRAINKVFADANLNVSNFAELRRIMKNPILVNDLDESELEKIFGYNSMLTVSEMRKKLLSVLELAKQEVKNEGGDIDDEDEGSDWSGQNLAVAASYHWTNGKTSIEGYFRFVGNRFYSAGSPDLLQNSRLLGGNFEKNFRDFWIFSFGYDLNVENASGPGDAYNIFGMAEGSKCGLIPGADDDWLKEHEQDANRTLYNHDGYVSNRLVGSKVELLLRYSFNYRTRSTNQRLYGNYSVASGIFDDEWFAARKNKKSIKIASDGDTVKVDSARWAQYYALADEKYLATQFEERLLKNTIELGLTFKLPKNILKIGGIWTFRTDLSKFEQDDLLDPFDFSDKTYGLLGYYFHGGDYFEQRYPVSLTTSIDNGFRNVLSVVPRYKIYNRDDMSEFEWTLMENMTIPVSPKFAELSLNASVRQYFLNRTENGKSADEAELDFDGSMALRFQHTKYFSTEWLFGSIINSRPDNPSEAYTDIYGGFTAKVEF